MNKMAANPQDIDHNITANYDTEGRSCHEYDPDNDQGMSCRGAEDTTSRDDMHRSGGLNIHERRPHGITTARLESSQPAAACAGTVTSQLKLVLHDDDDDDDDELLYADAAHTLSAADKLTNSSAVAAKQGRHHDDDDPHGGGFTIASVTSATGAAAAARLAASAAAKDSNATSCQDDDVASANYMAAAAKKPPRLYKWCGCAASSACSHSFVHINNTTTHHHHHHHNNNNNEYVATTPHHHTSLHRPHQLPPHIVAPAKPPSSCPPSSSQSLPHHPLMSRYLPHHHRPSQHQQGWWMHEGGMLKPVISNLINGGSSVDNHDLNNNNNNTRALARLKAHILGHPMYEQLLAAHVDCLRVATPVDHLPAIQSQLSSVHHVASRYSTVARYDIGPLTDQEKEELDRFMANYINILHSFREQLGEHVRVQAMEAIVSCWEFEQAFTSLTGVLLGDIEPGATMSDDENERKARYNLDFLERLDNLGLGPLIPTESERTLMERVRQELKSELKQGYKNKIADVREEILRKRRAGKLPSETTSILKKWWNAHSKWPYPTEEEKARLVQETGLELKQINNWFINQRKRNWHNHAMTTTSSYLKNETSMVGGATQASNMSLTLSCDTTERLQSDEDKNFHIVGNYKESI